MKCNRANSIYFFFDGMRRRAGAATGTGKPSPSLSPGGPRVSGVSDSVSPPAPLREVGGHYIFE